LPGGFEENSHPFHASHLVAENREKRRVDKKQNNYRTQKVIGKYFVENWNFPFLMVRKIFGEYLLWFHFVNGYEISLNFHVL
jgi:hypothetical protein